MTAGQLPVARKQAPRRGTIARAYAPRGSYWRDGFTLPSALYVNEEDIVFTAVTFDESWQDKSEVHSESNFLRIEELRLISAITLPMPIHGGVVNFHPLPYETIFEDLFDLHTEEAKSQISQSLRRPDHRSSAHFDYARSPPAWGGSHRYCVRSEMAPAQLQVRMYDAIDVTDHLMLRGLNALVRAGMLAQYHMFLEEATYALYVGLDASFALVRRRLLSEGYQSPSALDAAAWIDAAFNSSQGAQKYFEDFYHDRIRSMHPDSRFGIFPSAPLDADDYYLLFEKLRDVFNFLILGEVIVHP